MKEEINPLALRKSQQRDDAARKNDAALMRVFAETGFVVNAADAPNWRPVKPKEGYVKGVNMSLIALATDGMLILCRERDTGRTFVGHHLWFSEKLELLHSVQSDVRAKPEVIKPKTPNATKLTQRQRLLASI